MSTFALLPGAGGEATHLYSRVVPLLEAAGHDALAIDLPADDETAGLAEYADLVADEVVGREDVVLLAQSMGGFTAPLVARRRPLRAVVFLNAMIPLPGERASEWWDHTGAEAARTEAADRGGYPRDFDLATYFLHDIDADAATGLTARARNEAEAAFASVCDFESWAGAEVRAVAGEDDRFFPVDFQRRIARERLSIDIDVLPGGHLLPLSQPRVLADYLLAV